MGELEARRDLSDKDIFISALVQDMVSYELDKETMGEHDPIVSKKAELIKEKLASLTDDQRAVAEEARDSELRRLEVEQEAQARARQIAAENRIPDSPDPHLMKELGEKVDKLRQDRPDEQETKEEQ